MMKNIDNQLKDVVSISEAVLSALSGNDWDKSVTLAKERNELCRGLFTDNNQQKLAQYKTQLKKISMLDASILDVVNGLKDKAGKGLQQSRRYKTANRAYINHC